MSFKWALAAIVVGALWVCGCSAQAQEGTPMLPVPSGPLDSRTCNEIRDRLERMLYVTFKGSLPRRMLKEVLPGLVEPLLPVVCLQPGSDASKWLQQQQQPQQYKTPFSSSSSRPHSRPKRQLGMFMQGAGMGAKVKDPGDHPPPGMARNPFKDPGDRPLTLFGMTFRKVKDPGDRPLPGAGGGGGGGGEAPPPGEGGAVNPMMSSIMAMMRMMNFNRQRSLWAARAQGLG